MRDWSVRLLFVLLAACTTAPAVTVVQRTPGDGADAIRGDRVKLKRGPQEAFAHARKGFHVVRSLEDWQGAWKEGKSPPMPASLGIGSQMLLLAVASSKTTVTNVKIERALETAERVHVFVRETKLGEGCRKKSADRAYDGALALRTEKPVNVYVDVVRGESCGEPPVASVECRPAKQETWSKTVEAQPGDTVECALSATARGKFELVDKLLSMAELPPGSSAKLAFKKGPHRAAVELDVYGTYTIGAEAVDEAGRRGKATATIEAKPPKTKDVLVQLVWAGFDRKDESDTFPRVNLRVAEPGPKGQRCTAEIPIPGLCDVKTRGAYTYMRIPAGDRKLPVSVQFLDERVADGPGPCVHVWFDGARTAETCDRVGHTPDDIWRVGTLDTATGKLAVEGGSAAPADADAGAATSAK